MSPRREPRAFGEALAAARRRAEPETLLAAAQSAWSAAAGERIAAEARPVREREGILTVECRTAVWAQELDLLQQELVGGLNRALEPRRVEALRFQVGETWVE